MEFVNKATGLGL